MAKATKLPSGNWRAVAFVGTDENGKKIRKSFTAPTKREAELAASTYLTKKHHNDQENNISLFSAGEKYIAAKENILSPATIRGYRSIIKNLPEKIKKYPIHDLTNNDIQTAINDYAKEHSPKSVRNMMGFISATLDYHTVDLRTHVSLPQKQKTNLRIPTKEELALILDKAQGTVLELPIMLAAYMGLRRSEIAALKWGDVDFNAKTLFIHRAIVEDGKGNKVEKATKTTAGTRKLVMPTPVYNAVVAMYNEQDKTEPLVSAKLWRMTRKFPDLLKSAGIEHFNFHALRHYYASVMLSLNIPNKYAQERMGHSTDHMLKTVYQHLMDQKQKEVDDTINSYFNAAV